MGLALEAGRLRATLHDAERTFALDASGFRLDAGEIVALSGASGCGKTLLLELLCLIRRPDAGAEFALVSDGTRTDLAAAWTRRDAAETIPALRGRLFGFVPQTGGLLPFLTVRDNIALAQDIARRPDSTLIDHLVEKLGLTGLCGLYPDQLSIGQRQRVAIARALAHRPAALIADEPTAALDPSAARSVLDMLAAAAADTGAAVILSCHDHALLRSAGLRQLTFSISEPDAGKRVVSRLNLDRMAA